LTYYLLSKKEKKGWHDEDISREEIIRRGIVNEDDYRLMEKYTYALFARGTEIASNHGLILVDTKYEFGKTRDGEIVLIDEIHTIIGAGSTSGGTMDASNLLKPALAKGSLRCIGPTTYDEYRTIFDKDHALSRRFQKIDVVEPTVAETVQILRGLKPMFEGFHQVRYTQGALEAAAELSARYINERFLPDKAIDVMDEAGAAQRILPKSKQKKVIGKAQIETVIAKVARIPEKTVSHDDKQVLQFLGRDLKNMVYGQENAIDALVAAVKMSRSGLALPDKPIGCFLFSGPTGVGKTEVAKQLAYSMGVPLQRFDMSEYMERHAVSRPPSPPARSTASRTCSFSTKRPAILILPAKMPSIRRCAPCR